MELLLLIVLDYRPSEWEVVTSQGELSAFKNLHFLFADCFFEENDACRVSALKVYIGGWMDALQVVLQSQANQLQLASEISMPYFK